MGVFRPFGGGGSDRGIPSDAIIVKADSTGADSKGQRSGTIEPRRYGQLLAGEYATCLEIVGSETIVVKNQGTSTISISAGRITFGAGTSWGFSILFNDGKISIYSHPVKSSSTTATWYDLSDSARNLVMTVGSGLGSITALLGSNLLIGSDYNNINGEAFSCNYLTTFPPSNTNIQVYATPYGSHKVTKITSAISASIWLGAPASALPSLMTDTFYFRIKVKKLENSPTSVLVLRIYTTNVNNNTAIIESGPGTALTHPTYGYIAVSGLSENEYTTILVKRTGLTVGSSPPTIGLSVDDLLGPAVVGAGVEVSYAQLFDDEYVVPTQLRSITKEKYPVTNLNIKRQAGNIVCIGDSTVAGYVPKLRTMLPLNTILDKGVGGNTAGDVLARLNSDCISHDPVSVFLTVGVNDVKQSLDQGEILSRINQIIDAVIGSGAVIYVSTLTPIGNIVNYTELKQQSLEYINSEIKSINKNNCIIVDMYNHMTGGSGINLIAAYDNGDHLHYNIAGSYSQANFFYSHVDIGEIIGNTSVGSVTNNGRIKYPITLQNGTLFQPATTYTMPEAPELIDLLGAGGVWYNANGTAKTLTDAQFRDAINAASGWKVCANPDRPEKGIVVCDQSKAMLKALRLA